jgi:very-short-patch-repair endonuclease
VFKRAGQRRQLGRSAAATGVDGDIGRERRSPRAGDAPTGVDGDIGRERRSPAAGDAPTGVDGDIGRERRSPRAGDAPTGVDGDIGRERRSPRAGDAATGVDRAIARLATRQDGVVERRQLVALGMTAAAIDHRVRAGRLIVLYRGVYTVGHKALTERGRLRAALIAAGPTAVLSHRTAAALWKLIPSMPPFVDVTVTCKGPRSRSGLRVHETRRPPDIRALHSLPVTAPLRTLVDVAPTQPQDALERLCAEALVLKLVSHEELDAARILDPDLVAPTRSKFERTFRTALRRAGLPTPVTGHRIPPYTADFAWLEERVVVETDGWDFHENRFAFEGDRARDAFLAAHGWIVVRVTWRRLHKTPMLVMVQLAQTLALRASTPVGAARGGRSLR